MPKDATKKDNKKEKKEKKHFLRDFKAELKRVIWPTPKQLVNNTIAVITIVLITAVVVFALDFVFKAMNDYGVEALKKVVDTNTETQSVEDELDDTIELNDENETETEIVKLEDSSEEVSSSTEELEN